MLRWLAKEITLHFSNALMTPLPFVKISLRFLFPAIFLSSLMDSDSSLLDFYRGKLSLVSSLPLRGFGWDTQFAYVGGFVSVGVCRSLKVMLPIYFHENYNR